MKDAIAKLDSFRTQIKLLLDRINELADDNTLSAEEKSFEIKKIEIKLDNIEIAIDTIKNGIKLEAYKIN